ncbi:MAG: 3-methyl-2-oxobutanoate hydroxymethyltransferase [Planctomycetota bacterium]
MARDPKPITIHDLRRMKQRGEKITMVTCYDNATARIVDEVGVPLILIGDSLGMVMLGHDSTLRVTLDMLVHHTRAVTRAARRSLVVMDLPFATYSAADLPLSLASAKRAIAEGGAQAVKIEGGRRMAPVIGTLVASGIPVMGHIGLTPQSIHMIGGYRVQGRGQEAADRLRKAALALEEAGAFAIVLECVPAALARSLSDELTVPTIGIGAGPACDGQVQVMHDLLGLIDGFQPRHAKRYADLASAIREAITAYHDEVRSGAFPSRDHAFDMDDLLGDAEFQPPNP